MAACVAACQLQRNRFLVSTSDAIMNQSPRLCGLSALAPGARASLSSLFWKKRKLSISIDIAAVQKQSQESCPLSLSTLCTGDERKPTQSITTKPHFSLEILNHSRGLSYLFDNPAVASCPTVPCTRKRDITRNTVGTTTSGRTRSQTVTATSVSSKSALASNQTTSATCFCSPQIPNPRQQHFVRHFSRRHGDNDEKDKKPKSLRNSVSVMYIPNPITWLTTKWNTANLRRNFDPSFSENEFLLGAKQAISYITHLVSGGQFDKLKELVMVEAMEWLTSYRKSLSSQEQEALALDVDNLAVMKIVLVELDTEQGQKLAYVDLMCIGLKVVDSSVPYMVDLGLRFKRDYSVEPPSSWVLDTVRHIRLSNMTP